MTNEQLAVLIDMQATRLQQAIDEANEMLVHRFDIPLETGVMGNSYAPFLPELDGLRREVDAMFASVAKLSHADRPAK